MSSATASMHLREHPGDNLIRCSGHALLILFTANWRRRVCVMARRVQSLAQISLVQFPHSFQHNFEAAPNFFFVIFRKISSSSIPEFLSNAFVLHWLFGLSFTSANSRGPSDGKVWTNRFLTQAFQSTHSIRSVHIMDIFAAFIIFCFALQSSLMLIVKTNSRDKTRQWGFCILLYFAHWFCKNFWVVVHPVDGLTNCLWKFGEGSYPLFYFLLELMLWLQLKEGKSICHFAFNFHSLCNVFPIQKVYV